MKNFKIQKKIYSIFKTIFPIIISMLSIILNPKNANASQKFREAMSSKYQEPIQKRIIEEVSKKGKYIADRKLIGKRLKTIVPFKENRIALNIVLDEILKTKTNIKIEIPKIFNSLQQKEMVEFITLQTTKKCIPYEILSYEMQLNLLQNVTKNFRNKKNVLLSGGETLLNSPPINKTVVNQKDKLNQYVKKHITKALSFLAQHKNSVITVSIILLFFLFSKFLLSKKGTDIKKILIEFSKKVLEWFNPEPIPSEKLKFKQEPINEMIQKIKNHEIDNDSKLIENEVIWDENTLKNFKEYNEFFKKNK